MNKIKGYRNMFNETQKDWANLLGISVVSYGMKETKKVPFSDKEKEKIKAHIQEKIPNITIDDLFF
ncbi:hypothetical protein [Longibaculum muris]|uniref:hypothetical protein n=1 Tax=Longibaculum muris TaxID=1796628 RepID=UPI0029433BCD|nr:hypothetical protein [Longibaculum muris]